MLWTPGNRFNWWATNATAPAAVAGLYGTTVTAGTANTLGSTVSVLSALAEDCYGILIGLNGGASATAARNYLVNIRTDPAGGTSWSDLIPSLDGGNCGFLSNSANLEGPTWYYFPLFIKAGSAIGANCQCSVASATIGVYVKVFGKPTFPHLVRHGTFVQAFGITTASSIGTAVTPGVSAAEGSYTQIGSALTEALWWWQCSAGYVDSTQNNQQMNLDIAHGDASNKHLIFEDLPMGVNNSECIARYPLNLLNANADVKVGDLLYARLSTILATADASPYAMIYGMG